MKFTNTIACVFIFIVLSIALNLVHALIPDGFAYLHYSWIPIQIIIAGVISYRYYSYMNKLDLMQNEKQATTKTDDPANENVA